MTETLQLPLQQLGLDVGGLEHRVADPHPLPPGRGQGDLVAEQPVPGGRRADRRLGHGDAVLEQLGVDPLDPHPSLIDQRLVEPHPFAPLQHAPSAGSTTRAARRTATTRAASGRRNGRSWRAACGPAPPACRPAPPECASNPAAAISSTTYRQPVQPSTAIATGCPLARRATSRHSQRRNRSRSGCHTRPRHTSPDSVSTASKVIC